MTAILINTTLSLKFHPELSTISVEAHLYQQRSLPMYICLCRGITDRQIKAAIDDGARHLGHLRRQLGVATQCGKCACAAKDLLAAHSDETGTDTSAALFYSAAG